jgi:hypothetical protein
MRILQLTPRWRFSLAPRELGEECTIIMVNIGPVLLPQHSLSSCSLVRTEHMFWGPTRIRDMRAAILASTPEARAKGMHGQNFQVTRPLTHLS